MARTWIGNYNNGCWPFDGWGSRKLVSKWQSAGEELMLHIFVFFIWGVIVWSCWLTKAGSKLRIRAGDLRWLSLPPEERGKVGVCIHGKPIVIGSIVRHLWHLGWIWAVSRTMDSVGSRSREVGVWWYVSIIMTTTKGLRLGLVEGSFFQEGQKLKRHPSPKWYGIQGVRECG